MQTTDTRFTEGDFIMDGIIEKIKEFDPSDSFHVDTPGQEDLDAKAYYAAIDRVVLLLEGNITDWTSPRPLDSGRGSLVG